MPVQDIEVGFVRCGFGAMHRLDAVVSCADGIRRADAYVERMSAAPHRAGKNVSRAEACAGYEARRLEFTGWVASYGHVEDDLRDAVMAACDVSFGAAKSVRGIWAKRCFAAEQARGGIGWAGDTKSKPHGFSVVLRVEDGAFMGTERPQPRMVGFAVSKVEQTTAIRSVPLVAQVPVMEGIAPDVEDLSLIHI